MPGMKKKRGRGRKGAKTTAAKAPPAPPQSRPEPTNDGPGTDNPPYGDFGYFDVATTVIERRGRDLPSLANAVPSSLDDEETVEARALADALVIRPVSEVMHFFKLGGIETTLQLLALTQSDYLQEVAHEYLLDAADAGLVDAIASFFAPCEKKSVEEILPSIYHEGQAVLYSSGGGSTNATITQVHYDDELQPYYTIDLHGNERQTDREHLSLNPKMEKLPIIWLYILFKITVLLKNRTPCTRTSLKLKIAEGVKPLIRCLKRDNRREVFKSKMIWCSFSPVLPMLLFQLCYQSNGRLDSAPLELLFQDEKSIVFVIRTVFYDTHRPDITKEVRQWGKIDDDMVPELLVLLNGYIKEIVCSKNRLKLGKDTVNSSLMDIATTRIVYQHFDPGASTFVIGLTYLVKHSAKDEVKEVCYNLLQCFVAAKCVDKQVIKAVIDIGRNHVSCYEHACCVSVLTIQLVSSADKDEVIPIANESYMHYAIKHGLIEMIQGLLLEYWNDEGEIKREHDRNTLINLLTRVVQSGMEIVTSDRAAKAIRARSDAITHLNEQLESSISRICSDDKQQPARAQQCLAIVKFLRLILIDDRSVNQMKIRAEFIAALPATSQSDILPEVGLGRHFAILASLLYFAGVFDLAGDWSRTLTMVSLGVLSTKFLGGYYFYVTGMEELVALALVCCHLVWVFGKLVWYTSSWLAVSVMSIIGFWEADVDATSFEVELGLNGGANNATDDGNAIEFDAGFDAYTSEESTIWPSFAIWALCLSLFAAGMSFNGGLIPRFIIYCICLICQIAISLLAELFKFTLGHLLLIALEYC